MSGVGEHLVTLCSLLFSCAPFQKPARPKEAANEQTCNVIGCKSRMLGTTVSQPDVRRLSTSIDDNFKLGPGLSK